MKTEAMIDNLTTGSARNAEILRSIEAEHPENPDILIAREAAEKAEAEVEKLMERIRDKLGRVKVDPDACEYLSRDGQTIGAFRPNITGQVCAGLHIYGDRPINGWGDNEQDAFQAAIRGAKNRYRILGDHIALWEKAIGEGAE